jgi:hypothetical protein
MEFKHNSESMKTVVETFVIEETETLIYDNEHLDKWNSLVDELGLEGQKVLAKPEKSPIPFMHLKDNLVQTFETLCPQSATVDKYDITPIPLEILDLVALSVREKYFAEIIVRWDDKSPDPVCIGVTKHFIIVYRDNRENRRVETKEERDLAIANDVQYYYNNEIKTSYLIGKWADVKQPIPMLIERAKARYIAEQTNSHLDQIETYKRYINDLEGDAERRFS